MKKQALTSNDTSNNGNRAKTPPLSSIPINKSAICNVLAEVRATIQNPSRPFTPRDAERKLFTEADYNSRPSSAFALNSLFLTPLKVCCNQHFILFKKYSKSRNL